MFAKKFYIGTSDVDPFLELKISSLFVLMQDTATAHAEELGIGKSNTIDRGLFWVITRYSVSIIKMPRYLDTVIVKTYPGDDMKFIFPRYFQIENENGEVLVRASSTWAVVDKNTHHVSLNPFNGVVLPCEHLDNEEMLPKKVTPKTKHHFEDRKVRYCDTDLNSHLNNTKYIEFIVDMKSREFYRENRISHITINYEKEIVAGDTVSLFSNDDNPEYINGRVGDVNIFDAEIIYKAKD